MGLTIFKFGSLMKLLAVRMSLTALALRLRWTQDACARSNDDEPSRCDDHRWGQSLLVTAGRSSKAARMPTL
jgi:hypothetical protein